MTDRKVYGEASAAPTWRHLSLTFGIFTIVFCLLWASTLRAQENMVVSHGYSFYGDLSYPADFEHFDYVNPDAPKGGDIALNVVGTFDSMHPYTRKGRAGALSTVMYESLLGDGVGGVSVPADVYGESYCLLCERIEYPETKDWVIFYMRPEARFSDDTPVTAHDIAFSHNLLLDEGLKSYADAVRQRIPKVEVIDDYTIKFYFTEGISRRSLIDQVGFVPAWSKKWYEETGAGLDESRLEVSPGSGPYMIDSVDVNRRIVYKRNPDYWGNDLPINVGRNNFDTIRVEYFGDDTAAFEAFKAGEYTFRSEGDSKKWATGYDFPKTREGQVLTKELPDGSPPTPSGIVFNLGRETLQDRRVRQALALAFNFEWTNESLQYGLFKQRASYTQDTPLMASGLPDGAELAFLQSLGDLVPEPLISEPALEPHTSSPERLQDRDNMRAAAELLDAAGWPIAPPPPVPPTLSTGVAAGIGAVLLLIVAAAIIKMKSTVVRAGALVAGVVGGGFVYTASQPVEQEGDGMRRNAQGETLALNYLFDSSSSPTASAVMENYVSNVQALGVDITFEKVDSSQYTTRERDRDYDLVFDSYGAFLGTGTGLMQRYGSEAAEFSLFNPAGLASPLVDAIIDRSLNATTREEEEASLMALDRALRYEFIMIPVWYNPSHWVAFYDQYEHPENIPPFALGHLDFWWYNQDKADALRAAGALR